MNRHDRIRLFAVLLSCCLCAVTPVLAHVSLPSIFSSGMVLQQSADVRIWGKATVNHEVHIETSWDGSKYDGKADGTGKWEIIIKTPAAGGPFEIRLNDGTEYTLRDVLIGEVWLCSGQSNMEMPVKGFRNQPTLGTTDLLLDADNSAIRLFQIPQSASYIPLDTCAAAWQAADVASVKEFSAVGYQFATMLQRKLKVPIGIIQAAYGGTRVEAWMDANTLKLYPGLVDLSAPKNAKPLKNDLSVLFNAMIRPIMGYHIRGAIWYQGEANISNAAAYKELFAGMVRSWRESWKEGDFPFYYVQIAPFQYDGKDQSPYLREAQLQALDTIPASGMVVSMDVGAKETIHPPDKTTIAKRLSYWAFSKIYGIHSLPVMGPVYQKMGVEGPSIRLYFKEAPLGLTSFGKTLSQFEVAGPDHVFHPAEAKIMGKAEVLVNSEQVKEPVAVRYAFKDWVIGDLYNTDGLPASSFRTDDWK